ncbi:MAG TPA: family 78 glycoside hydrolase catalytic domain [Streptosporangiaceae bacterium]|jgi:alpha-L-rhamnosidase
MRDQATSTTTERLRCEYLENPIGIDAARPRLSWRLRASRRDVRQTAYQLQVAVDAVALAAGELLWDSGRVASGESLHREYEGPAVESRYRYHWRVRVWDDQDEASPWSDPAWWEMGLLRPEDWTASWIEVGCDEDPKERQPAPYLRRVFELPGSVRSARIYVTAHGLYELHVNGRLVGDEALRPRATAFRKRLEYQAYDVTEFLQVGENVVGVVVGDGRWRGSLSAVKVKNVFGDRLGALVQVEVELLDGSRRTITSDGSWRSTTGPIRRSDPQNGESYDARRELTGWAAPGYDDARWNPVRRVPSGGQRLVATSCPPVRAKEELAAQRIIVTPDGRSVVDFGQNINGWCRLRVRGPAGTTVVLQHGESLDEHGNFSLAHLSATRAVLLQRDEFTLRGAGAEEVYEPHFSIHGFRYVQVEGFPGELTLEALTAVAVYSDLPVTGSFACSDERVNQLQRNILWSQKGNFTDVPSDCPTRERSGWTGDIQVYAPTASFLMESAPFLAHWLRDLALEQSEDGRVPSVVPIEQKGLLGRLTKVLDGSAGWGDAAVVGPWTVYRAFADARFLEEQYPSMKAWVDYMDRCAQQRHWTRRLRARRPHDRYLWDSRFHYGEWSEPDAFTKFGGPLGTVAKHLVLSDPPTATAFYAWSSGLLAQAAAVLGRNTDSARYADLSARVKEAWMAEFAGTDARLRPDRQATYVRALAFDLVPAELRPAIAGRLVELIRSAGTHLDTGFLSTPLLCHVLTETGHVDVAYDLLEQDTAPSWLYSVTKGATTIWETWQGIEASGKPVASLNHYAFGAVGRWLYEVVGGIRLDPEVPAYRHAVIHPQPGGHLTSARAGLDSPYGEIVSAWEREDARLRLSVILPPNTTATVHLEGARLDSVREAGAGLVSMVGLHGAVQEDTAAVLEVGSGSYEFTWPAAPPRSMPGRKAGRS